MGDRVLFQVVNKEKSEFSPIIYGHWDGSRVRAIAEAINHRMQSRRNDVDYTAARLVQALINDNDGSLGYGLWNATNVLSPDDSQGDAGCVLVIVSENGIEFEVFGGYYILSDAGELEMVVEE